jgi:hypothetical protein
MFLAAETALVLFFIFYFIGFRILCGGDTEQKLVEVQIHCLLRSTSGGAPTENLQA